LSWDLPSLPSFSFSLKGEFVSFGFFFLDIIFDSNIENTCSHNLFWEEKNDESW
jgi:hypothetical protein